MALWGNNDNVSVQSGATVTLDYDTLIVTGTGTTFGTVGYAKTGDLIRFGHRDAAGAGSTYYGDAVIVGITSLTQLTIGSTAGLAGGMGSTSFTIAEGPVSSVIDNHYSETNTAYDSFIYGISTSGTSVAQETAYQIAHGGWVGITTYTDMHGNLRVKSETLVAMSGIETGNRPTFPGQK